MRPILDSSPEHAYAYVWPGVLLFAPDRTKNVRHAHFAATVLMAVNEPFNLTLDGRGRGQYEVALLGPNVYRQLDTGGQPLVDILIDPDDPLYRYLYPLLKDSPVVSLPAEAIEPIRDEFRAIFAGEMDAHRAARLIIDLLSALSPRPLERLPWDERVLQATAYMRARLLKSTPSIPEIAEQVGLSESRLMHLFRDELGLPIRRYLLWLRVRRAMQLWARDKSLSEIALGAGFYDQAHFGRTLRRMTGYLPSVLNDPERFIKHDGRTAATSDR